MANGCVLVSSDGIGSTPYLIENGKTGFTFRSPVQSSGFDNPDMAALDDLLRQGGVVAKSPQRAKRNKKQRASLIARNIQPEGSGNASVVP